MDLHDFAQYLVDIVKDRPLGTRPGQWAFNLLAEHYPAIARDIRGTMYDPFYVDSRLPAMLSMIANNHLVLVKAERGEPRQPLRHWDTKDYRVRRKERPSRRVKSKGSDKE